MGGYNSWIEVNLDLIKHNVNEIKTLLKPGVEMMGIVKGNAYGHGIETVGRYLVEETYVNRLGVANVREAEKLRNAGISSPILVLGGIPYELLETAVELSLSIPVYECETVREVSKISKHLQKTAKVHIKVDTGLNRIGAKPGSELADLLTELKAHEGLEIEGLFTHFAEAGATDKTFSYQQLDKFKNAIEQVKSEQLKPTFIHSANSGATLDLPESQFDYVRTGSIIYGYYDSDCLPEKIDLRPAIDWKAKVTYVKEVSQGEPVGYFRDYIAEKSTQVATLSFGYGDGYSSAAKNGGYVLINGYKAPFVGRICMDQCFIDVSHVPGVRIGDEVVIMGQSGDKEISAFDISNITGGTFQEVISNIGGRVGRKYLLNGKEIHSH